MFSCFGCSPTFFNPRACQTSSKYKTIWGNTAPCGMVRDCARASAETLREHGDVGWFCQWYYTVLFGSTKGKTRFRHDTEKLLAIELKFNWLYDIIIPSIIGVVGAAALISIFENWERICAVVDKGF